MTEMVFAVLGLLAHSLTHTHRNAAQQVHEVWTRLDQPMKVDETARRTYRSDGNNGRVAAACKLLQCTRSDVLLPHKCVA